MHTQKGQSLIEFALVLPFLFVIVYGIICFGQAYSDYQTLNTSARNIAYDAALQTNRSKDTEIIKRYTDNIVLMSDMYTFNSSNVTIYTLNADGSSDDSNSSNGYGVKVVIAPAVNKDSNFTKFMETFTSLDSNSTLMHIEYIMSNRTVNE